MSNIKGCKARNINRLERERERGAEAVSWQWVFARPGWLRLCDGWTCEMVGSSHPSDARPEWSCQLSITARSDINHCYLLSSLEAPPPPPSPHQPASPAQSLTLNTRLEVKHQIPGLSLVFLAKVFANIKKAILHLSGLWVAIIFHLEEAHVKDGQH